MKCQNCNGFCCHLEKREGTTRYAQLYTHGEGVHWCKSCEDGTDKRMDPLEGFFQQLRFLWEEYVLVDESELTEDAKELRAKLLDCVKESK